MANCCCSTASLSINDITDLSELIFALSNDFVATRWQRNGRLLLMAPHRRIHDAQETPAAPAAACSTAHI
jgi:hypothetical protein